MVPLHPPTEKQLCPQIPASSFISSKPDRPTPFSGLLLWHHEASSNFVHDSSLLLQYLLGTHIAGFGCCLFCFVYPLGLWLQMQVYNFLRLTLLICFHSELSFHMVKEKSISLSWLLHLVLLLYDSVAHCWVFQLALSCLVTVASALVQSLFPVHLDPHFCPAQASLKCSHPIWPHHHQISLPILTSNTPFSQFNLRLQRQAYERQNLMAPCQQEGWIKKKKNPN